MNLLFDTSKSNSSICSRVSSSISKESSSSFGFFFISSLLNFCIPVISTSNCNAPSGTFKSLVTISTANSSNVVLLAPSIRRVFCKDCIIIPCKPIKLFMSVALPSIPVYLLNDATTSLNLFDAINSS